LAEDNCTVRFANFHRHDAIILLSSGERRLGMLPGLFLCIEGRHFNYALLAVPNHCVNHCYNAPSPPNAKLCALSLGRSIAGRCQLDPFRSGGAWDEAPASDRPVAPEVKTDPEVLPPPQHFTFEQIRNLA